MNTTAVIILQTDDTLCKALALYLEHQGFSQPDQFITTHMEHLAEKHIVTGDVRQMFVTGTLTGDQVAANNLVERLKERSPNLFAVSFSAYDVIGKPYDLCIKKNGIESFRLLAAKIYEFLEEATIASVDSH